MAEERHRHCLLQNPEMCGNRFWSSQHYFGIIFQNVIQWNGDCMKSVFMPSTLWHLTS